MVDPLSPAFLYVGLGFLALIVSALGPAMDGGADIKCLNSAGVHGCVGGQARR